MFSTMEQRRPSQGRVPLSSLLRRRPNLQIGERPCINGDRCLAQYLAKIRYGTDTAYAFTCTEFLLPDAYANFLNGKGLPDRRGKCLLCTRYFHVRCPARPSNCRVALTHCSS